MQDRLVDRPDLQFDPARVAEFLRQRDLVPGEARLAHIDGEEAGRLRLPAIQQAGLGLEGKRVLAGFLEQQRGDAAHAVAAGAHLRAVVVVDADKGIGAGRARRMERHQLVVGGGGRLRGGARFLGGDGRLRAAHIHHHDLVAETVHADERLVGERAHGEAYMANRGR